MKVLEVKDLVKQYGSNLAVSDIDFSVDQGEIFGLLGPNGAGKSTTLNIITGLIQKDSGTVTVLGHDLDKELTKCKQLMGIVPQDLAIYEDLTAAQNVAFFGSLYGLTGKELHQKVDETLEFVGLLDKKKVRVKTFSGGMKRRLNIACGLIAQPEILFLDEPTVGIDPQSRNHILESIRKLNDQGMTVIYTTHYMEEAEELCDRIAIMDLGQIVAQGSLEELKSQIVEHWFIKLKADGEELLDEIKQVPGVESVEVVEDEWLVACKHKGTQLRDIIDLYLKRNQLIEELRVQEPNLEDIFLTLTGKTLRD